VLTIVELFGGRIVANGLHLPRRPCPVRLSTDDPPPAKTFQHGYCMGRSAAAKWQWPRQYRQGRGARGERGRERTTTAPFPTKLPGARPAPISRFAAPALGNHRNRAGPVEPLPQKLWRRGSASLYRD
jgi:hypothetical protein